MTDTMSGDAAKRATAIAALADAPKAQAVPVLRRLLTDAEPQVDRPLALRSLRDLALNQGDADGTIREAVRNAIYHGDDQTKADDVQEVLDIIEESEHQGKN
jgi:HEAT repeat protein